MKRRFVLVLIAGFACWIVLTSKRTGLMNNFGQDRTGSPFNIGSCGGCHSGGFFAGSVAMNIKDKGTGTLISAYEPDSTYELEIQVNAVGGPATYGMQSLLLYQFGNLPAGTLSNVSSNGRLVTNSGRTYFEHNNASAFTTNTFTADWTAPSAGGLDVIVYASGIASNRNGSTGGDAFLGNFSQTYQEAVKGTSASSDTVCNGDSTSVNVSHASGSVPVTYYLLDNSNVQLASSANGSFKYVFPAGINTVKAVSENSGSSDTLTFTVVVDNQVATTQTVNPVICKGETYAVNSSNYSTTGTYNDTLQNSKGCDSVYLTINLTANDTFRSVTTQTICQGNTFNFRGNTLSIDGHYYDTLSTVNGCDSIFELDLTVNDTFLNQINDSACSGDNYVFNGNTLTSNGLYLDTFNTVHGCDSVVALNFAIYDTFNTLISNASVCAGEAYTFGGSSVSPAADTVLFINVTSSKGCDSLFEIQLKVEDTFRSSANLEICEGETISINGNAVGSSGVYLDTLTAANGCDSLVEITLSANDTFRRILFRSTCAGAGFFFNGANRFLQGNYLDTLSSVKGCDSAVVLQLTIKDTFNVDDTVSICIGDQINFGGTNISTPGNYSSTLTASNGCDSVVELTLLNSDTFRTVLNEDLCCNRSYAFGSQTVSTTGTYYESYSAVNGCDSLVELFFTATGFPYDTIVDVFCEGDTISILGKDYTSEGQFFDTVLNATSDTVKVIQLSFIVGDTGSISDTICIGDTVFYLGEPFFDDVTDQMVGPIPAFNGCDSFVMVSITAFASPEITAIAPIAKGDSFTVNSTGTSIIFNGIGNGVGNRWRIYKFIRRTIPNGTYKYTIQDSVYSSGSYTLTGVDDTFQIMFIYEDSISDCPPDTGIVMIFKKGQPSTGIYELGNTLTGVDIYPNPTKGYLQVESVQGMDEWILHDLSGKVVQRRKLSGESSDILNLESYTNGIYLLSIYRQNQVARHRIQLIR